MSLMDGWVSQGLLQIVENHLSADDEPLPGNRARHGMGGSEREETESWELEKGGGDNNRNQGIKEESEG